MVDVGSVVGVSLNEEYPPYLVVEFNVAYPPYFEVELNEEKPPYLVVVFLRCGALVVGKWSSLLTYPPYFEEVNVFLGVVDAVDVQRSSFEDA